MHNSTFRNESIMKVLPHILDKELPEENELALRVTGTKTECVDTSYSFELIGCTAVKSEAKEESCDVSEVKEELKLKVSPDEDEVFLERSTGFLSMCSHNDVSTGCNKSPLCILCYFKMNDVIDNPADCEVRSVIRFLNAQHLKHAEIYRQFKEVYGDTVMNERNVRKWCEMFNNGRTNVHDETRPGHPSLITEDLKTKVNDRILQDRRTSLDELHIAFPDISRSLLGEIVSQYLGYHKICARWVPRQLSDQHKTHRMASALTFLMRYHTDGDAFLDQIVTGDETWVSHNTPETKRPSRLWHHHSSPKKSRKLKQTLSTQKVMATVFWDRKGVLLLDFMPKGTTINANCYCETLRKLRRAIQNKRRGILSRGVVLLHDNARPHIAASTRELLDQFGWEIFDHPPYSPDLAPSDFHLFTKLKDFLGGTRFGSDEELKKTVKTWLNELAAEEYNTRILKLVNRYDKCLNLILMQICALIIIVEDNSVFGNSIPGRQQSGVSAYNDVIAQEGDQITECSSENCESRRKTLADYNNHHNFNTCYARECNSKSQSRIDEIADSDICNRKGSLFKCNICGKFLSTQYSLTKHLRSHSGEKPFKCDVCGKCFLVCEALKVHLRSHTGEKPYKCDICSNSFSTKSILINHLRLHTGEKPFKCEVCGKCFIQLQSLKNHERHHNGEKPYKCDVCGKCFAQFAHLKRHLLQHAGQKPFNCVLCGKWFSAKGHLKIHSRQHTGEKPYKCDDCGICFSDSRKLKHHRYEHTGQNPFQCDVCGKCFTQKAKLKYHAYKHTGEKPFKCQICLMGFSDPDCLKYHSRKHTGEKPFQCNICEKRFSKSGNLKSHANLHVEEKPFSCDFCGKCYPDSGSLRKHVRLHTGETPFHCNVCGKCFSHSGVLKRHMRVHTGEKPFKCEICGKVLHGIGAPQETCACTHRREAFQVRCVCEVLL
ncbi:hypothetical protein ANN_27919 [Periplaneta americana]|uniref:C2H2-type domain-containing protein n=1 Tax=Periplaneta americana TaxID=6978 RepID=A0ABQ8RVL8_PERAM|nr:hypothetical protein ANN_27919 [Periplaneta americana]